MFAQPDDPHFAALAGKALSKAGKTADMCEHPELIPKLTKLWFYKIIILCGRNKFPAITPFLPE
jgi:hypothetical protein